MLVLCGMLAARWERGLIRHDSDALARAVMEVYHSLSPTRIY